MFVSTRCSVFARTHPTLVSRLEFDFRVSKKRSAGMEGRLMIAARSLLVLYTPVSCEQHKGPSPTTRRRYTLPPHTQLGFSLFAFLSSLFFFSLFTNRDRMRSRARTSRIRRPVHHQLIVGRFCLLFVVNETRAGKSPCTLSHSAGTSSEVGTGLLTGENRARERDEKASARERKRGRERNIKASD